MPKLTPKQRNDKRVEIYEIIKSCLENLGEDIDYCVKGDTKTAILNMPIVINGEDAWGEIMVSIPTKNDYDGYAKREDYKIAVIERAEKEKKKAEDKAKKIAKDEKRRAKEKEKEV